MALQKQFGFLFVLRLLTVTALASSTLSGFGAFFYNITLDNRGKIDAYLGYNCSTRNDFPNAQGRVCDGTSTRSYSLWRVTDAFNVFHDSGLCVSPRKEMENKVNLTVTSSTFHPDLVWNVGHCTRAALSAVQAFAILTAFLACTTVVWIIVLADHHEEGIFSVKVHLWLSTLTAVFSILVIALYTTTINPLRFHPRFCEVQTTFSTCIQSTGNGLWFQLLTFILAVTSLVTSLVAQRKRLWGYDSRVSFSPSKESMVIVVAEEGGRPRASSGHDLEEDDDDTTIPGFVSPICTDIHFWIKLGRVAEFLCILIGIVSAFTEFSATVPPGPSTPIPNVEEIPVSSRIRIFDDIFCTHDLLWWSFFTNDENATFGQCDSNAVFHIRFASLKVLFGSGLAMIFKRDACKNPFFYLIGVVMDFLSMVFISLAIGLFYSQIYPGRDEIRPSYCEIWQENIGTHCTMKLGLGFWFYCAVLVLTTVNFTGEFLFPAALNETFGVRSAVNTVLRRIRERRFKDLHKPQSVFECPSEDSHQIQQEIENTTPSTAQSNVDPATSSSVQTNQPPMNQELEA